MCSAFRDVIEMQCCRTVLSLAAEEQTVSIDVMDVSDFDGDDNGICNEVPPSPRPPSSPRPQSQIGQHDVRTAAPQGPLMGRRMKNQTRQRDRVNAVRSILCLRCLELRYLYLLKLDGLNSWPWNIAV